MKDDVAASHKGIIPGNSLNVTREKSLYISLFSKGRATHILLLMCMTWER